MSLYFISDVHIKQPNDFGDQLLTLFLGQEFQRGDEVYLLGDIFDLMIGGHEEYFADYSNFFNMLKDIISKGVKVYFFEGNHDFHLEKLFEKFKRIHGIEKESLVVVRGILVKDFNGKKYHISHGDDIEIENPNYQRYKKIVNNSLMRCVANYIMPYSLLNLIGKNASSASRKRNESRYQITDDSHVKDKFRRSVLNVLEDEHYDFLICGHSHVKDDVMLKQCRYLNGGYARIEKQCIKIDSNEVTFISLI